MPSKAFRANGTIRVARFVKIDPADNHSILECDANERTIGISQEGGRIAPLPSVTTDPPHAAVAGDDCRVYLQGENCLLFAGTGGWTAGDLIKSGADGEGIKLDEGSGDKEEVGAIALETVSAGEYGKVEVRPQTVTTETS